MSIIRFTLEKISVSQSAKIAEKYRKNIVPNNYKSGTVNRRILLQMLRYPEISVEEISEKITVPLRAVKRCITSLKEAGIIHQVGSDKTEHWKVLK